VPEDSAEAERWDRLFWEQVTQPAGERASGGLE
jgi:hypothetical protein